MGKGIPVSSSIAAATQVIENENMQLRLLVPSGFLDGTSISQTGAKQPRNNQNQSYEELICLLQKKVFIMLHLKRTHLLICASMMNLEENMLSTTICKSRNMLLGTACIRSKRKTCSKLLIRLIGFFLSAIPSQKNTFVF